MNPRPIFHRFQSVVLPFLALTLVFALNQVSAQQRNFPGASDGAGGNTDPFVRMVRHNDGSRTVTARSDLTNEFNPNLDER